MKQVVVDIPTFAFVITTRAALAAGLGLLLSDKLSVNRRRGIGAALLAVGAVTTIPAALSIKRRISNASDAGSRKRDDQLGVNHDDRLIGATRFPRKGNDDFV
jgi:hypothetical protein